MQSCWEITQEVKNLPNLNKPIFIEGLPGIGNVGKIAVDFLVDELGATKIYSFFSHKFPHSVFVNHENLVELPKLEIYYKKYNGKSKKRDLLILVGDIQPIDEESCYQFCEELLKIIKQFKCTEVVTLGGIGLQAIPEKPRVFCTSNSKKLLSSYTKKELSVQKNIFGVVGPIIGVSGVLLGLAQRRRVKGVSLLAETFAHPMYLGIKGAKELLRVIDKKHTYKLNIKKLSKEIIAIEQELMSKTKEWASEISSLEAGAKLKNKEVSYIG